jgi:CarboxypepD_reg-like domain
MLRPNLLVASLLTVRVFGLPIAGVQPVPVTGSPSQNAAVVYGQVLNPDGLPLAGATVLVAGTRQCVATDGQGDFALPLDFNKGPIRLVCGYVGYQEQTQVLRTRPGKTIQFQLLKRPPRP